MSDACSQCIVYEYEIDRLNREVADLESALAAGEEEAQKIIDVKSSENDELKDKLHDATNDYGDIVHELDNMISVVEEAVHHMLRRINYTREQRMAFLIQFEDIKTERATAIKYSEMVDAAESLVDAYETAKEELKATEL